MKITGRQLVLLISMIISFLTAILVIISLFLDIGLPLLMIFVSTAITFVIVFFLMYYAVNNFIFEKINPIYLLKSIKDNLSHYLSPTVFLN